MRLLEILVWRVRPPKIGGVWHLLILASLIAASYVVFRIGKKHSQSQVRRNIRIFAALFLSSEILKQIYFTFLLYQGSYPWFIFPFQFCSMNIYILAAATIARGRLLDGLYKFLAYVGLIGGFCTLVYPNSIFGTNMLVNLHSISWHCGMVLIAVYMMSTQNLGKRFFREVNPAAYIWLVLASIGFIINLAVTNYTGQYINLFFFNPYQPSGLPPLDNLQVMSNYPVRLTGWIAALYLAGYLSYLVAKFINRNSRDIYL